LIEVKLEREGDRKFLKDSDGFHMEFEDLFGCHQGTDFGVILV